MRRPAALLDDEGARAIETPAESEPLVNLLQKYAKLARAVS